MAVGAETDPLECAEARARELADEQAALRRVATLVAREPPPSQLFALVADQVARVFDVPLVRLIRYEADASVVLAAFSERDEGVFPIGSRWPLDSPGVIASIRQSGRPARVGDYKTLAGEAAEAAWRVGMRSAVGSPIVVGGRLWGAIVVLCPRREPLPEDTEARLADFTDLVATAIANAETRGELLRAVAEQRAQRRAATMVAAGASQVEVFTAITASASELFNAPFASLLRFGADDTATMVAGCESCSRFVGRTWSVPPQDPGIVRKVLDSGQPARIDDHSNVHGPLGEAARALRVGSVVGVPVILDGSIWGVLAVGASKDGSPLPDDTADRLVGFTELVSASIDDTESRQKATRLLNEQAALRRVATFVAGEVGPDELFSAVSDEVAQLFEATGAAIGRFEPGGSGIEAVGLSEGLSEIAVGTRADLGPSLASTDVYRTGRAVRREVKGDEVDDAGAIGRKLREMQVYSTVAAPITVGGRLWGVLTVVSAQASLPVDTEERLQKFGELIATAIANAEGRAELAASETRARGLADEQAALRRVATLVAHGISPKQLFVAVCDETAQLVNAEITTIGQFERSEPHELAVVGLSSGYREISIGTRVPRMDWLASSAVYRTRRTSRRDVTAAQITDSNPVADSVRAMGFFSTVSAPILVEGALWGVLTASSSREALPEDTERRLESFSELIATAIANAQSRGELAASEARARALAEEQAALRRIATLVAEGATPDRVFDLVREEASRVSGIPLSILVRYDADGMATLLSTAGPLIGPVGTRFPLEGDTSAVAIVYRTGRAARVDYSDQPSPPVQGGVAEAAEEQAARWSVGVPVIVDDLLWGVLALGAREGSPPADAETQLGRFAGLLAMAISNANDRTELAASEAHARELANEQAALRRVATLVAQGASSDELFSAVAEEVASIIDIPVVGVHRYEDDGTFTMLGIAGETNFTVGSRWPVEGDGIAATILDTGAPARKDDYSAMPGRLGKALREDQMIATVGVPIVVDARIWGFMAAAAKPGKPIPRDTEERLVRFTELVATAVSNATTRTDLLTSRTRLVNAADETRRRLERDLHDGIQQWLVALALKARRAAHLSATGKPATQELAGLADDLVAVTDELREISRGIHPAILTDSGLDEALKTLARRSPIRVDLDVDFLGRYDATLEATVYYVAAESITNAVKHAQASAVTIRGGRRDESIELEIVDDGVGGADPRRGTGLIGLKDRVDTLGGTILIASPAGAGTSVRVKLPAGTRDAEHPAPRRSETGISASTSG